MRVSEPKPLPDLAEYQIEMRAVAFERALARHARSQMRKKSKRGKPGPSPHDIPRSAFAKALVLLEVGEITLVDIAEKTGVDRHDVAKIRDWRNGRGYEVHPGSIPNTVIVRSV
jgi:hypothetical protein